MHPIYLRSGRLNVCSTVMARTIHLIGGDVAAVSRSNIYQAFFWHEKMAYASILRDKTFAESLKLQLNTSFIKC